jgi:hypothetical protein
MAGTDELDRIFADGADRVRERGTPILESVRKAVGVGRHLG